MPPPVPFLPQPRTLDEVGIDLSQLADLCLKTIYAGGRLSAARIGERMALPFAVIEPLLDGLKQGKAVEVVGSGGLGEQQYRYALSEKGAQKAIEVLERNQYIGPAPVALSQYTEVVLGQAPGRTRIAAATVNESLEHLVLNPTTRRLVGAAVNSGRSMLLHGAPGNGKSSIAKAIGRMLEGCVLIPHAIDVNGQTIKVWDPQVHVEASASDDPNYARRDQRWVVAHRPLITVGGELTLDDLELRYSPQSRFYVAPAQVKANCGVLVIDDFGRQRVHPKDMLNRWIIPMESRIDHLSLLNGGSIEVPFELLLVFATNLKPSRLGDEAFFRRIRHKVEVGDPDEMSFLRILRSSCEKSGIRFTLEGGSYLIERYYRQQGRRFRAVHPRDLVDLILDISRYEDEVPEFTADWIDLACASYFIDDDDSPSYGPTAAASPADVEPVEV